MIIFINVNVINQNKEQRMGRERHRLFINVYFSDTYGTKQFFSLFVNYKIKVC